MTTYALLKWLHVLLFGFWLGSDFGTFASSRFLMDARRDLPTRLAFARALTVFDLGPRVALILLLPLGVHLATVSWGLELGAGGLALVWVASLAWLTVMLVSYLRPGSALAAPLRRADTVVRSAVAAGLVVVGVVSLASGEPLAGGWLAWKVLLFGLVVAAGLGIRVRLPAFERAFGAVAAQGSTPEREAELRRSLVRTYPFVMTIWVLVLTIGYLGVAKP